ncbi:sensor histidine kinase [Eubacterium ramulus]
MKTWKSFVKRNIEWMILSAVLFFLHVLYLFLIGRTGDDLIYAGILDLCIIAAAVCMAYIRYYRKVRHLKSMLQQPFSGKLKLPETEDLAEELLGQLAENANIERQLAVSAAARQQSEMKDYYAKWVHQIKTPIAGMQLLLQMERSELEEAEAGDESESQKKNSEEFYLKQLQNLTDMEDELFRIEEYVGMALQYQRLNSTANDYILKRISLDAVIREVIHKYAKIMIRRKIRMHYEKTEATVISDEKWLAFVLEQLLSNAVKYTPEGEIIITVEEEPQQIWLEIRDTGIGICSEDIPRVFEKGYTGFNGHEDKRSTGIGLYLCREVLQKLGHTIQIQSEMGVGTNVKVGFSKDTIDFRD